MKESKELAKTINESVDELLVKISDLYEKIELKDDDIKDLENELEELRQEDHTPQFEIEEHQNNLRTTSCLEKLFDNLDRIPIAELEELTEKHNL